MFTSRSMASRLRDTAINTDFGAMRSFVLGQHKISVSAIYKADHSLVKPPAFAGVWLLPPKHLLEKAV